MIDEVRKLTMKKKIKSINFLILLRNSAYLLNDVLFFENE